MYKSTSQSNKLLAWSVLILLIGAGFVANIFKITLFFNVDLIFGSFFVMLVISLYGPVWGTVAGAVAGSYTYILWNHPYAIIIFTCEALFVGLLFKRKKANLVFFDVLYWFVAGMPLVYLFYHGVMNMDNTGSILIMFKQSVNGILNALLARIVLMIAGNNVAKLHPPMWSGKWQFTNILFNTIIGFVVLPSLVFVALSGWFELDGIEQEIKDNVVSKARATSHVVNLWIEESIIQTRTLALSVEAAGDEQERGSFLEKIVGQFMDESPEIVELYITDSAGDLLYYSQSALQNAESGAEPGNEVYDPKQTTDRLLSWVPGAGERENDTEITALRNLHAFGDEGLVLFRTALPESAGSVLMVKKSTRIRSFIDDVLSDDKTDILILDQNGTIVMNTGDEESNYGDLVSNIEKDRTKKGRVGPDVLRWIPPKMRNISVMERWEKAVYILEDDVEKTSGWKSYSIASVAPYQSRIYYTSLWKLSIVLVVIFITVVLSRFLAARYVRPIRILQTITTDLPEELEEKENPEWPETKISEISALITNFRHTTASLKMAFSGLRDANKELSQEKEKAEAASRAKSRFLANMSHDIRTPLTAIKSLVELLLDDNDVQSEHREDMETIRQSTDVLLSILNNILDLSRIEAGRLSIEEESFKIQTVIGRIIRLFSVSANIKGIHFSYSIDPDVPSSLRGDPVRIEQVLLNLIGNALKFTEEGEVTLEVKRDRKLPAGEAGAQSNGSVPITFYIRDTGIGIPPDKETLIFESFSQADSSITRSYGGSGLGLTISRELVTLMHGTLSFTSTPGEGSLFFFTLPLKGDEEQEGERLSQAAPKETEDSQNKAGFSFLVADDDSINRIVAKKIISGEGHHVETVSSGGEAVEVLKEKRFDCLFLDIYMPGLNGIETAGKIRSGEIPGVNRNIPIIGLSGSSEEEITADCKRAGMNTVITKPLTREKVEEVIKQWMSEKK